MKELCLAILNINIKLNQDAWYSSHVKISSFHLGMIHQVDPVTSIKPALKHIPFSLICELRSCRCYVSYNGKTSKRGTWFSSCQM